MKKFVILLGLVLTGCSTVTMQPEQTSKYVNPPTYEDSKNFFFWGLVGEHRVNVTEICGDKEVIQMQSQQTFQEGVFALLTLGIYSPHSVKVWCSEEG
ncbi:Bor family protein [Thalassotalea sp. PS06]|nr:Bor family protein [Thalassotalea sp. PS06]